MRNRGERGYWAFVGHRLSGLALAAFVPLHFLLLGEALNGAQALQGWLHWAERGWVKLAEWGLVSFLVLHLIFGLRILAIEFGPRQAPVNLRLGWILPGLVVALIIGALFFWMAAGSGR
ncbi:MAG: succinate dehydrogenase [Burkholderiaceae bacterium]